MYTSDIDLKKNLLWNIIASIFLALFGAIYEKFSHEVYSYFMIYAFAIPLLLGALTYSLLLLKKKYPKRTAMNLWNAGTASLCVGCLFRGVLDIYGTTNKHVIVYPIVGTVFLAAGLAVWAAEIIKKRKSLNLMSVDNKKFT